MPHPLIAPSRRHDGREGTREPGTSGRASRLWRDEAAIRGAELQALVDAAGRCTILPLVGGIVTAIVFWTTAYRSEALGSGAALAASALASLLARRLVAGRKLRASAARTASGVATVLAGAVGLAWGVLFFLLYPGADAGHRLLLIAMMVAALAEGRPLMAARRVGWAYLVPACGGSLIGLFAGGGATGIGLGLLALLYGWHLVGDGLVSARVSAQGIADRLRVAEQQQTIDTLLLDFDEASSDWLWRTDAEGRLVGTSEGIDAAAARLLDATAGEPFAVVFTRRGARPNDGASAILAALAAQRPFRDRLVEIETDRETRWWRLSGKPLLDEAGRFGGYIGVGSDVSGARNSESRIAYLANFDALTGFANRSHFQAFAARQCALDLADGRNQGLLCLDLDGFKIVNDSIGHDGGDEILKQVSARLTSIVPADAFIARLGGDEFGIWLPSTTPAKAEDLARTIVATLGAPYDVDGLQADIGASIGIALTPRHATTLDELRVRADLALYHAKGDGRGRACTFEPAFETALIERRKLERDLKLALARGEFLLHYQPLVDLTDGRVASFEALIRWQSPERGLVSPAAFIPAAESSGLIVAIGRWVLFEACRAAAGWPEEVRVAVNVSPPHVRSADFLHDVTMALKTSGLHPSRLEIEVTEGVFLDRSDAAMAALQALRVQGVTIALDDFGTGYSSLNYLVNLPVDKIKIDRSFVTELLTSPAHQAVVDAILGLARKLSIRVTAEGIETKEQARALKMRRCDHLQGYLFGKPRPLAEVPEMIAIVPERFREAVPSHIASPLAMALAARQQGTGQAA